MKSPRWLAGVPGRSSALALLALPGALALGASALHAVQPRPPISGVTGTMALEGTMKQFYRGANTVVVVTKDGVEHAYRFSKDLLVHGGKGTGVDALAGLREGTTVVVHYVAAGAEPAAVEIDRIGEEGLKVTEGVVTRIDRGRKQISIRFDSGKTEVLRLTDRAAAEAGAEAGRPSPESGRVIVYYSDERGGQKLAHFFKPVSGKK